LPLEPGETVPSDDDRTPCEGFGGARSRQLGSALDEFSRRNPGSAVVGNVAVSAGHRIRDADPGRGDHVPQDVDILFPELLTKLPGLLGLYREDVLQVHGDVEGGQPIQHEKEAVQDSSQAVELASSSTVKYSLVVGSHYVEVLHLRENPCLIRRSVDPSASSEHF
jgi:hypothetical protein